MDNTVLKQQDFADAAGTAITMLVERLSVHARRNGLLYHSPDFSKNCVRSSAKVV